MSDYCDSCDNLKEFCECNSIDKIYIVDLEATSNKFEDAKILELSIFCVELPNLVYKEVFYSLVNRKDLEESEKNKWIFKKDKLTLDDLDKGKSLDYLSNKLVELLDNGAITSFNNDFDLRLLNKELLNEKEISLLRLPCIMETATKFCKVPATKKQRQYSTSKNQLYKTVKLDEAYKLITGKNIFQTPHRASEDAMIATEIIIELIRKGEYDLSELNKGKYNGFFEKK